MLKMVAPLVLATVRYEKVELEALPTILIMLMPVVVLTPSWTPFTLIPALTKDAPVEEATLNNMELAWPLEPWMTKLEFGELEPMPTLPPLKTAA